MPYVLDLVRLATSIQLAPKPAVRADKAIAAVLRGYHKGLGNPQPALLFEGQTWLRSYAEPEEGDPEKFWRKIKKYPEVAPPADVVKALRASLPKGTQNVVYRQVFHKGGGSLGRPRFLAVGYWRGGQVLREAKALVPSAWTWANGPKQARNSNFLKLANSRYRAPDRFLELDATRRFILRRVAGDARKIEFGDEAGKGLHLDLMEAMGFDVASIHAADKAGAEVLQADLAKRRPHDWLHAAAGVAADKVKRDYQEWCD
jgi:hypothetical protein